MPEPQPTRSRPRGDPLALFVLAAVVAVLVGGYFLFPWLLSAVGRVDCLASGRVTGC